MFSHPGGDSIQAKKTAEYLNKLEGVSVTLQTVDTPANFEEFDLLHLFNVSRPADLLGAIEASQLPYVVSTIYIDYSETERNHPNFFRRFLSKVFSVDQLEYIKTLGRILKKQDKLTSKKYLFKGQKKAIKAILSQAEVLLPNSESEYGRLSRAYRIDRPYRVIPNAIDLSIFQIEDKDDASLKQYENAVISVGQMTPVKNQLKLIEALNGSKYRVFIIGKPASNSLSYYEKCKELAESNITFVPFVEQGALASIYQKAKVHVLPSWFETTGLVSLEAMYMGCNIVITDKGDQKEYFGKYAFYCEPSSATSIKNAVDRAYEAPYDESVKEIISQKFTWEETAIKTYEAYQIVLPKAND